MSGTNEARNETFLAFYKELKKEMRGVAKVTLSEIPKKREVEEAVQIRIKGADYSVYLGKETILESTTRNGGIRQTVLEIGIYELKYFVKHNISGSRADEIVNVNTTKEKKEDKES